MLSSKQTASKTMHKPCGDRREKSYSIEKYILMVGWLVVGYLMPNPFLWK